MLKLQPITDTGIPYNTVPADLPSLPVYRFSNTATELFIKLYIVTRDSAYLEGGHSCSLVLGAHVLLEHSQGDPVSTQVAADQLDVHPELTEDNGLCQALALLLGRL